MPQPKSIWPTNFAQNLGEVQGISPLPVITVTGKHGTGKSLFGHLISPVQPGTEPTTVVFDMELGNSTYENQFSVTRHNMMEIMQQKFPKGWKPIDLYKEWLAIVKAITPGQYDVCILDPISELEDGLKAWVEVNPGEFNHTPGQYKNGNSLSGLYWGDVKTYWKRVLSDLAVRFQTTVIISHLRQKYDGNTPIKGQYEPKGLATLNELASLALWLVKKQGQAAPAAEVSKSRLTWIDWDNTDEFGEPGVMPMFPNTIPMCTPSAIKKLMAQPRKDWTPEESAVLNAGTEELSDDERLELETKKAAAELTLLVEKRKVELLADLKSRGYSGSEIQIGVNAAKAQGEYSLENHDNFLKIAVEAIEAVRQPEEA